MTSRFYERGEGANIDMHGGVFGTGLCLMGAAFFIFWMELSNPFALVSLGLSGVIMGVAIPPLLGVIGFIMFLVGLLINPQVTVIQQPAPAYVRPYFHCSKCGNPVDKSYSLCPYCGKKLWGGGGAQQTLGRGTPNEESGKVMSPSVAATPDSSTIIEELQPPHTASQASAQTSAFCGHCGRAMQTNLKFCPSCGKPTMAS